ncbi:hypothetical protein [Mesorhizobium sp.]|uniref:hypothetical protein n=1 Tax=Mesorhizobium sp. TaxID=1871066 RepID=UPI001219BC4F|nr:hypothetical protein [Mesorhizobium sp.]TIM46517.1 MAG: hypothetical protein E5Y56_11545 [Mesorhizobium sp.]
MRADMNTSLLRASGTAAVFPSLLRNAAGGKAEPAEPASRRATDDDPREVTAVDRTTEIAAGVFFPAGTF